MARQESYESEVEDDSVFTTLLALRELLSPYPANSALNNLHDQHGPASHQDEDDSVMEHDLSPEAVQEFLAPTDQTPPQTPAKPVTRYSPAQPRAESPAHLERVQRRSASPVETLSQPASSVERFLTAQHRSESPSPTAHSSASQTRSESPAVRRVQGTQIRSQSPAPPPQAQRRTPSPVQGQPQRAVVTAFSQRRAESPVHALSKTSAAALPKRSDSPVHPLAQRPATVQRSESPPRPGPTRARSADVVPQATTAAAQRRPEPQFQVRTVLQLESAVH